MQHGRKKIFTNVREINKGNVISVLKKAIKAHACNADDIQYLLDYEAGEQKIIRVKTYRSDIDCICIDNVANEVCEFKEGFHWGNPITLVLDDEETVDSQKTEQISLLNKQFKLDGNNSKIQEIGRFVEICGVGYEFLEINPNHSNDSNDESYFTTIAVDPRYAFMVYSDYYFDKRQMMGVTFRTDEKNNSFFTCITPKYRFEIGCYKSKESDKTEWKHLPGSGEMNPFGIINLVEWVRYADRMGCFERQLSELDNLNLLISDFSNDVDQNTQAIWHGNDIEFPKDEESGEEQKPETGDWIITNTTTDGRQPFVKPLAVEYDYAGMLNNILARRSLILQKCKVPQRNDNSGGSTGIAMSDATGWSDAEMAANKQQPFMEKGKTEETKIALAIIRNCPNVEKDNPLCELSIGDMKPNIKRQKTYEMVTKINTFATGVSHGLNGLEMLKAINLFDDPNEVWEKSKEMITEYQKSIVNTDTENKGEGGDGEEKPNKGRLSPDISDQIGNSPMVDKSRETNN